MKQTGSKKSNIPHPKADMVHQTLTQDIDAAQQAQETGYTIKNDAVFHASGKSRKKAYGKELPSQQERDIAQLVKKNSRSWKDQSKRGKQYREKKPESMEDILKATLSSQQSNGNAPTKTHNSHNNDNISRDL